MQTTLRQMKPNDRKTLSAQTHFRMGNICDGLLINARENGEIASPGRRVQLPNRVYRLATLSFRCFLIAWLIKILPEKISGRMELSWITNE